MKGFFKVATVGAMVAMLGACSNRIVEFEQKEVAGNPAWYNDCKQIGSEGWLFWKTDYAYSCGMGESKFEQASESQAYAFAVKGYAERINGEVNSSTTVDIRGNSGVETRVTRTVVEHSTKKTSIREHVEVKKKTFQNTTTGRLQTYVRIKMPLEVFDGLLQEAKDEKNARIASTLNNG